jgi:hypothetical protein
MSDGGAAGTQRASRARSVTGQLVVVVLAALAGLVAAATGDPVATAGSDAGRGTDADVPADPADSPVVVLLGSRGPDGTIGGLVLYGFPDGDGEAHALLVPPATLVDVASFGTQPLADIVRIGSPALLETSVENALGIGIDVFAVLDESHMLAAFASVPELSVTLTRTVQVADDLGTIAWPPATHDVDTGTALRMLAGSTDGGPLAHLTTVRAVWEAWRDAVRDRDAGADVVDAVPVLSPMVTRAARPVRYDTLPVEGVGLGDETRFRLRRPDAPDLVRRVFEWALLNGGRERPRVEIRNGVGEVGLTASVAELVVPAGAYVTLTGNVEGFGVERTVVAYHDQADREAAERLATLIGTELVIPSPAPVGIVDVTIYVGADFVPPP